MLPILYQSHDVIIYSYPLFMGLGWGIAYQIFFSLASHDYPRYKLQLLYWGIFLSAWFGAKSLFYLTYPGPENILSEVSFWTGGGFVFYGGFLGAIVFISFFKLFNQGLPPKILWSMLPALSIGHGIGRIGCFLAGCCFGRPTDWIWGVFLHGHDRHPTQLIEAFGLFGLGLYFIRSRSSKSILIANYLIFYAALRFSVELLRGDGVRGQWGPLTPSQWISLLFLIVGLGLKFRKINRLAEFKQY